MPNFRLIGAAVKPAFRHEHTNTQTDRQMLTLYIYIYIYTYILLFIYIYLLIFFHINEKHQRVPVFLKQNIYRKKILKRLVNVLENLIFLNVIVAPRGADGI